MKLTELTKTEFTEDNLQEYTVIFTPIYCEKGLKITFFGVPHLATFIFNFSLM
jgi:hypothetical protein